MIVYLLFAMLSVGCALPTLPLSDVQKQPFFRNDYAYMKDFDAFYKVHKSRMKFADAHSTCLAEGAHLFVPNSANETNAVFGTTNTLASMWIGVHDLFGQGLFVAADDGQALEDGKYSNWRNGEPNNVDGKEHCVTVAKDTYYNDMDCQIYANFACKRPNKNITWNEMCHTYDTAYVHNGDLQTCYKLHKTPQNWRDAFKTCKREQASLVVINGVKEAQYLTKLLRQHPAAEMVGNFEKNLIHVGFNDLINEGIYLTIDGKSLSESGYEEWSNNQPDNSNGVEHCGSMFRDGKLNDFNCNTRAMFVCTKRFPITTLDVRAQLV